jgi:hypothetical protein
MFLLLFYSIGFFPLRSFANISFENGSHIDKYEKHSFRPEALSQDLKQRVDTHVMSLPYIHTEYLATVMLQPQCDF